MKFIENIVAAKQLDYVNKVYNRVEVIPGVGMFNQRCHLNAVDHALKNKQEKIALVIYMNKRTKEPFIHFVNVTEGGVLVDNTKGEWSSQYDYWMVRYLSKKEFFNVIPIFQSFRNEMKHNVNFFLRLFSRYTP
jgi:myo-inositol-1-phosphate synthase